MLYLAVTKKITALTAVMACTKLNTKVAVMAGLIKGKMTRCKV